MDKETWLFESLAPQWDGNILPTSKDVLNSIYDLLYKKTLTHSEALGKLSKLSMVLGARIRATGIVLDPIEQ
jgi:hypothetical protein